MEADGIARDGIKPGDVVVVTGGGGGFGRAFSRRFAGAKVAVWDLDAEAGEEIVREIAAGGGEACFIKADLARTEDIAAAVARTLDLYGILTGQGVAINGGRILVP